MTNQKLDPLIINIAGVTELTTFSRPTIYRRMREDKTFPRPRKISGTRRSVWVRAEIENWLMTNLVAA